MKAESHGFVGVDKVVTPLAEVSEFELLPDAFMCPGTAPTDISNTKLAFASWAKSSL